jgi:hypothetical protein
MPYRAEKDGIGMIERPPSSRFQAARLLLGFAILPVANALLAFLVHRIVWSEGPYEGSQWADPVDAAIAFAAGVAIVALIMTVAGGVPTVAWLLTRGNVSLKQIIIAAVALGNAPFAISAAAVVLFYLVGGATSTDVGYVLFDGPVGAVRAVVIGSVMGFASGVIFWAVVLLGTGHGRRAASSESDPTPVTTS